MTNENTTQAGIYEIDLSTICHDTGYNNETVKKLLDFFIEKEKIKYSPETDEIALKNWPKYNDSISPKVKKCIANELKKVKNRVLIQYVYSIDTNPQEEKEPEEKEEEKKEEICSLLWINVFLNNAGDVEKEFVGELINKFGQQKTKTILKVFRENGFKKIATMREAIDEEGNLKPRTATNADLPSQISYGQLMELIKDKTDSEKIRIQDMYGWNEKTRMYELKQ